METELIIEGGGFPPMSARGCHQTLTLVPHGEFRRTVNGDLCFMGSHDAKYRSIIGCDDKNTLINEGVLGRGALVRVGCLQRLWQKGEVGVNMLSRAAVVGSVCVMTQQQEVVGFTMIDEKTLCIENVEREIFISYRPWLWMHVVDLKLFTDEWGLKCGWRIDMEEK